MLELTVEIIQQRLKELLGAQVPPNPKHEDFIGEAGLCVAMAELACKAAGISEEEIDAITRTGWIGMKEQ
jgi:hypothetical protein